MVPFLSTPHFSLENTLATRLSHHRKIRIRYIKDTQKLRSLNCYTTKMAQSLVSAISTTPIPAEDQPTFLETGYTHPEAGDFEKTSTFGFPDPAKTWNPDARVYYARRLKSPLNSAMITLSEGFPSRIGNTSLIWSGQDLAPEQYVFYFNEAEIAEVESALKHFTGNHPQQQSDHPSY